METGSGSLAKSSIEAASVADSGNWRSVFLSMVIHATLLVMLALFWTNRVTGSGEEGPRRVEIVLASAEEDPEYFDESDMSDSQPAEAAEAIAASLPDADEQPPVDISQLVSEVAPIDLPLPGFNSAEMVSSPQVASPRNIRLTEEQQRMLAAESAAFEARRPKGPATTLRVFGSGNLTGRKFVFVIDRSKSMGGQGLNVLKAASQELANAVGSLESFHEFQILAYHHKTLAIGKRALIKATDDNKSQVAGFVQELAAFGGTEHELALTTALSMNPDVVVLLTDGGLPVLNESQLLRIRRAADGAQIHCLQFGFGPQQESGNFMSRLAGQNLGSYRYIDVTEWDP